MPGGDLLTFNDRGLCRWPVEPIGGRGLRIGPPEPLAAFGDERGTVESRSGRPVQTGISSVRHRSLGVARCCWIRTIRGGGHCSFRTRSAADLAISPDGRWACSGSRGEADDRRQVKVWDASTGKLLVQLPLGPARVAFSPDSRWLGVGGEARYRFFRTGSWTAGPGDRARRVRRRIATGLSSEQQGRGRA